MSASRPIVSAELIAAMIQATPDRVRRRLDREPEAAANWQWQTAGESWSVQAGGETVTLPLGQVSSAEQVKCTCLLSPRCFHVLACLTKLEVAIADPASSEQPEAAAAEDSDDDVVEPDERQRGAARDLRESIAGMLRIGAANAGVVVQSGLLRAVHQCRAEGLHRLAALGLRVVVGARELRARAKASNPAQLATDVADVLETSQHILHGNAIPSFWVGSARRAQRPVRPRKLHGLLAEPIVTRTGFAGAAVYFLGEDDRIYSASDVRPGDAQLARDAYLGGIEIGPMILPAKQLARGRYLGADLTASADGRLGRGKSVKIVDQGGSTWIDEPLRGRFSRPLPDQWSAIYETAALPEDARSAGWDFVFFSGMVLGAAGPELAMQVDGYERPLYLAIANESEFLFFRENLRMLCHAPGLKLLVVARANLHDPTVVVPLAVAPSEPLSAEAPQLAVPASLSGRVCLGFDEIPRSYLLRVQPLPVLLHLPNLPPEADLLGPLRRRWVAAMASGFAALRQTSTKTLTAESAQLSRSGLPTAASLLEALARANLPHEPPGVETFLATAVYLRGCTHELAKSRAHLAM